MGSYFSSFNELLNIEDEPIVEDMTPSKPAHVHSLASDLDPRSPTDHLTRTPIVVENTPKLLKFDPRSPTEVFHRTPLVSDEVYSRTPLVKDGIFNRTRTRLANNIEFKRSPVTKDQVFNLNPALNEDSLNNTPLENDDILINTPVENDNSLNKTPIENDDILNTKSSEKDEVLIKTPGIKDDGPSKSFESLGESPELTKPHRHNTRLSASSPLTPNAELKKYEDIFKSIGVKLLSPPKSRKRRSLSNKETKSAISRIPRSPLRFRRLNINNATPVMMIQKKQIKTLNHRFRTNSVNTFNEMTIHNRENFR